MSDLRKLVEELMPILDRWKMTYPPCSGADWDKVEALRTALAQPEPEPVAWHEPGAYGNVTSHKDWALANGWEPLYPEKT